MTDTDMLYMASLEKRNEELEAKVAELEGKHWNECGQIAHYSDELRKAKDLLKAAVEDFKVIGKVLDADCDILINCEECPLQSGHYNCRSWNHQDEALALIGEDTNVPASKDDTNVGGKIDSWISVKDRLPESGKEVLVWYRYTWGAAPTSYGFGINVWHSNTKQWREGCLLKGVEVLYWQPLPEPPKDGEQND